MPRPGPRPYECMRRAWHSDRHQPMRGSLIREIFRVVSEIHSPATKKNKEWQEKVPIVVLKAEEIMYSKANSEAEYMDLKTLWDRTNDAINIIIRREESTESSDLLQPCIEAALILGCIPRRASRSQRHNNPRTYLSSTPQEVVEVSVPPKITKNTAYNGSHPIPLSSNLIPRSKFTPFYSNQMTPSLQNSSKFRLQSFNGQAISSTVSFQEFPFSSSNFHGQSKCSGNTDIHPSPGLGRMYPLHYSTSPAPHCYPTSEPNTGFLQNVLNCSTSLDASNGTNELCPYSTSTSEDRQNAKCDLSLRLGRLPVPSSNVENRWICEVEDLESTVSCDEIGFCDPSASALGNNHFSCLSSSKRGKGFCFFPTDDHPFKSASSNPDRKGHKRKAPIGASGEDLRSYLLMSPSSKFFGRVKGPNS